MHIFEVSVFGIQIAPTWYWLMYTFGFIICYLFMKNNMKFRGDDLDTLLMYVFFGVILGGRIWYVLLYNPMYFIENIKEVLSIWKGGMSFHGWLLWVITAVFLFAKRRQYSFWKVIDTLAIIIPIALWLWRIGNTINQELLGFSGYSWPLALQIQWISYFPSTLLEAWLEWILLFLVMLFFANFTHQWRQRSPAFLSSIFLIGYSVARLIAEQFRLPDAHIGYLWWTSWVTLGMLYTLPFLIWGIFLILSSQTSAKKKLIA